MSHGLICCYIIFLTSIGVGNASKEMTVCFMVTPFHGPGIIIHFLLVSVWNTGCASSALHGGIAWRGDHRAGEWLYTGWSGMPEFGLKYIARR